MLFRMQTNKNHIFDNMWKDFQKGLRMKNPIAFRKKKDRLDFLIIEENETVGFVLMGVYPNSLTPFDGFIQAFYIKPEFRDKGYARNALKEIMSNYMGLSMS